jgi:hypothetical protein
LATAICQNGEMFFSLVTYLLLEEESTGGMAFCRDLLLLEEEFIGLLFRWKLPFSELVFTELIFQILYWIYEIAIHRHRFTYLYSFVKSIFFLFGGELGCF